MLIIYCISVICDLLRCGINLEMNARIFSHDCLLIHLQQHICTGMWDMLWQDISILNRRKKSKQIQRQPGPFIQMQICLLTKRKKKELANIHFYGMIILVKKKGLCIALLLLSFLHKFNSLQIGFTKMFCSLLMHLTNKLLRPVHGFFMCI